MKKDTRSRHRLHGRQSVKAEIIKNALIGEGLHAFIEARTRPANRALIGIEIKIQVPADEAARARKFVAAHERAHPDDEEEAE